MKIYFGYICIYNKIEEDERDSFPYYTTKLKGVYGKSALMNPLISRFAIGRLNKQAIGWREKFIATRSD